jgi:hypothetical protein
MVEGGPHDGGERRSGASNSTKVKRQSIRPISVRTLSVRVRLPSTFAKSGSHGPFNSSAATLSARESTTCVDGADYEPEWWELADFDLFSMVCIGRIISL